MSQATNEPVRDAFDGGESPDLRNDAEVQAKVRVPALIGLGITLAFAIGGYLFLTRATDEGIQRLARIDVMRANCVQLWNASRNASDSVRVDATALADTIDPRSSTALKRCGDLRAMTTRQLPNNREMSGEPMPKGLR